MTDLIVTQLVIPMTTNEWQIAIAEDIDALCGDASENLSPYMLGVLDAEEGKTCTPETYYVRRSQMIEYADGHESVAGRTPSSNQIMGRVHVLTQAEMDACTDDYEGDIEDRMFWSRGGW
jgi:hypothetical protein